MLIRLRPTAKPVHPRYLSSDDESTIADLRRAGSGVWDVARELGKADSMVLLVSELFEATVAGRGNGLQLFAVSGRLPHVSDLSGAFEKAQQDVAGQRKNEDKILL